MAALADSDYNSISSSMVFPAGSTDNATRCVGITVIDDSALEGDQTFTVTLTTSDPGVILGTNIATITIIDNDS